MKYTDYNDNELLSFVYENSEEANEILFKKYEPLIVSIATKMIKYCSSSGFEVSDLVQEGMVALNIAINRYKENKDVTFYTFAKTCIERRLLSIVISTKRLKNKALNESLSIENDESYNYFSEFILSSKEDNPETKMINSEIEKELISSIKNSLTDFEFRVFELKINGFNYKEIASILDKDSKSIDNALQRIKNKIKNKEIFM